MPEKGRQSSGTKESESGTNFVVHKPRTNPFNTQLPDELLDELQNCLERMQQQSANMKKEKGQNLEQNPADGESKTNFSQFDNGKDTSSTPSSDGAEKST